MQGARAVQRSIIEGFPHAEVSISVVWIDMLPGDDEVAARRSARTIDDPRVRHFYDPEKRSGKAVAQSLDREGRVAWDIYLFYAEGSEWTESLPAPTDWAHQLPDDWADRAHFRSGSDLDEEFQRVMRKLGDVEKSVE